MVNNFLSHPEGKDMNELYISILRGDANGPTGIDILASGITAPGDSRVCITC
jgi:hypothetical protein